VPAKSSPPLSSSSAGRTPVRLKLLQTTYRLPSEPVKGCENWFVLQRPWGVGRPIWSVHSGLSVLTSFGVLKCSP
jgi:hypothetical protein